MKQSMFLLSAAAAIGMAQSDSEGSPVKFLNSNYDIVAGKKFELKYSGCDSGCDIYLMNGPAKNLKEVAKIATDVDGEASSVTIPENAPKDEYAFKIVPKEGNPNYSELFPVGGTGEEPEEESSSASSASASSTSEEASTSTETETEAETTVTSTSTSEDETSTETSVVSSTSSDDATPTPSETATETDDDQPEETTSGSDDDDEDAPDAASTLAASGVTFFAAAAALVAYIL